MAAYLWPLVTGLALGGFYYGGLWLTVRRGIASSWGGALFLVSFLLRSAIVLAGFYLVGVGSIERILACLAGFIAARLFLAGKARQRAPAAQNQAHDQSG